MIAVRLAAPGHPGSLDQRMVTGEAMTDLQRAFDSWITTGPERHERFNAYVNGIAQARYVIRKVLRIVDDQAKQHGLDPLEHQMLIQVYAAQDSSSRISDVAERLDIVPAFASRLTRGLEDKGLVRRSQSPNDRRSVQVVATPEGMKVLRAIDSEVHRHVEYFQLNLTEEDRIGALSTFAFYLGIEIRPESFSADIRRAPHGSADGADASA